MMPVNSVFICGNETFTNVKRMTTKLFIWYFILVIVDVGNTYQKVLNKSGLHVMTINKSLLKQNPVR